MAAQRPPQREIEEDESIFVPMTDMVVSFLFIMMLLLAFFAVKYSSDDFVPKSALDTAQNALTLAEDQIAVNEIEILRLREEIRRLNNQVRNMLTVYENSNESVQNLKDEIQALKEKIKELQTEIAEIKKGNVNLLEFYVQTARAVQQETLIKIETALRSEFQDIFTAQNILLEVTGDALRFKGQGLFADGSDQLFGDQLNIVKRLGDIVLQSVSCITVNAQQLNYTDCNPTGVVIEAIQIEGHTDARGSNNENLALSTRRANSAFFAMQSQRFDILDFKNVSGQPVLSVAGYGEMRPVADDTEENRGENRRIDLRIIMYTPASVAEVRAVQDMMRVR